jgi:hypothetical protein
MFEQRADVMRSGTRFRMTLETECGPVQARDALE